MRIRIFLVFLLALFFGMPPGAIARQGDAPYERLPKTMRGHFVDLELWFEGQADRTSPVILEFKQGVELSSDNLKSLIPGHIGQIIAPVFVEVKLAKEVQMEELRLAGVKKVYTLAPSDKMEPSLWEIRAQKEEVEVVVQTWDRLDGFQKAQRFAAYDLIDEGPSLAEWNIYRLRLRPAQLLDLASLPWVRHISWAAMDQTQNFMARGAQNSAPFTVNARDGRTEGLHGEGVTLGIGDNASGVHHIDLKDRVVDFIPFSSTNHGVHISGIAAGAGILDRKGQGMAREAQVLNLYYSSVWTRTPYLRDAYGMSITNNSYAARVKDCEYAGTYDLYAQTLDHMALSYPDVLHVFAAGNDGNETCDPYPKGFATLVGGYQPAKNALVVTSTDHGFYHAWDASMGPVKDGRIKPEITAVGREVYSTIAVDSYMVSGGTSMASPQVAGAAAILTEAYRKKEGTGHPSSALLKALLMNGARDLGRKGPDYEFGFGFLNLGRSLAMIEAGSYEFGRVGWAETRTHQVEVPPGTAQLKVMLYWHDQPATPKSLRNLVQDLDLEVMAPDQSIHLPLILDPSPEGVWEEAKPGKDRRNNAEQVVIDHPAPGTYTLKVHGFGLPEGDQPYVLAYDPIPSQISLRFPVDNQAMLSGDSIMIYWESYGSEAPFDLEFSDDDGGSWTVLAQGLNPENRGFLWHIPNLSTYRGKLRIRQGPDRVSEVQGLMIHDPVRLELADVQCPGSLLLQIDSIADAQDYQLWIKEDHWIDFQERKVEIWNGKILVRGLEADQYYYVQLRPVFPGQKWGYPSNTLKSKPDQGHCRDAAWKGDLAISAIDTLPIRRHGTSIDLDQMPNLAVQVQNRSPDTLTQFRLDFSHGAIPYIHYQTVLLPGEKIWVAYPISESLIFGEHLFSIELQPLHGSDPFPLDNHREFPFLYASNPPLEADLEEGFESWTDEELRSTRFGMGPDARWDFLPKGDTGRLRTSVLGDLGIEGKKSLSLDAWKPVEEQENRLVGTFNLSNYRIDQHELRIEFDFLLHGGSKFPQDNGLWIRGSDRDPWKPAMDFPWDHTGAVLNSGTLSLNDLLEGQSFSSSFQLMFVQKDSSLIAENHFGTGLSIDNWKLFEVFDDLHLLSISSPQPFYCGTKQPVPVIVQLHNGVYNDLHNIRLFYQLNDDPPIEEMLSFLGAKQTMDFSFDKPVLLKPGENRLRVWSAMETDSYPGNDSLEMPQIFNQPLIQHYPYFQGFEADGGSWYAGGRNRSWQWGPPQSPRLRQAFEGKHVWKTGIQGYYHHDERSYLYSPCFDLSSLSHPYLQFYMIQDLENCEMVFCDGAYMEYRLDAGPWERLGSYGEGENWYSDSLYQVWNQEDQLNWTRTGIPLPKGGVMQLRFALETDPAFQKEGIAIDAVEVMESPLHQDGRISVYPNPVTQGAFRLEWGSQRNQDLHIILRDLAGRKVFERQIPSREGRNRQLIQTSQFAPGLYLLHLEIGDYRGSHKLIYL